MAKIMTLEELAKESELAKACNMTIGLCHGVFDLVHIDHIEHFRKAKEQCGVLVVSLTPDKFVNKGPGRPFFNEHIRAEYLSHIDYVDIVVINNDVSACDVIELLKPDFYFKGAEYRDGEDLTGKLRLENECLEKNNGKLIFTDTKEISSTNLINSFLKSYTAEQKKYIDYIKNKYSIENIKFWLDKLKDLKVMTIGDSIIDAYHYVKVSNNIATKSPNISTKYISTKDMNGGIHAIASHVSNFVNLVYNATSEYPVILKERFLAKNFNNQKLFEMCIYPDKNQLEKAKKEILKYVTENINEINLILIADFGHDFITKEITNECFKSKKFVAMNVQTNSANFGFNYLTKYKLFNFAALDEKELRLAFSDNTSDINDLAKKLKLVTGCQQFVVTLAEKGLRYYDFKNDKTYDAISFENSVVDTLGAGDAVFSIASLLAYVNCPGDLLAFISNCAGGLDTKIVGNENYITYPNIYNYIKGIIS